MYNWIEVYGFEIGSVYNKSAKILFGADHSVDIS
jgi:hypothetical protein